MWRSNLIWAAAGLICLIGCQSQPDGLTGKMVLNLPGTPYEYGVANNQVPTLGRVLFYDPRLSVNNSVSCSSCHKQAYAFSDNVTLSRGFQGKLTFRNSLPIQNVTGGFNLGDPGIIGPLGQPSLFWDGREKILNVMVLRPITNHVEMGIDDLDALAGKLSKLSDYQTLFTNAYGSSEVTQDKIADALSQFVASIRSSHSRADLAFTGGAQLTALESEGRDLFFNKYNCNSCHQTQDLNGYQMGGGFVNIGLDQRSADPGFADVTGSDLDQGKFRIPTLRNIALTAPYMHDGRFSSLDEVLDHYSHGINDDPNLDQRLRSFNGAPVRFNITDQERQAIKAFLNTLTDYQMITDPKFSNPFRIE